MKVIDCHAHPLFEDEKLKAIVKQTKVDFSYEGLIREMKKNNVERIIAIAIGDEKYNERVADLAKKNKRILAAYFINIPKTSKDSLNLAKKRLKEDNFGAIKLLPGFGYFYPNERKCEPIYKLAEKYDVPVIIHSGDPFFKEAKVKYTHPIYIDDVAVEHPNMKILMAHAGNPWIFDAAEITYKNENVFLDISGWFVGEISGAYAKIMKDRLNFIIGYLGNFDKVLYGTDWPLARMKDYINFVKSLNFKNSDLRKIMYKNALNLFWRD